MIATILYQICHIRDITTQLKAIIKKPYMSCLILKPIFHRLLYIYTHTHSIRDIPWEVFRSARLCSICTTAPPLTNAWPSGSRSKQRSWRTSRPVFGGQGYRDGAFVTFFFDFIGDFMGINNAYFIHFMGFHRNLMGLQISWVVMEISPSTLEIFYGT